jgi:hypothetical protein
VLKSVIDEIRESLTGKVVVVPSNRSARTRKVRSHISCRKGNPLARL